MKSKDVDRRSIWLMAKEYLSGSYVTFEHVGANHGISGRLVSNILWRGIAENILSTTDSEAIYAKVVNSSYRGKAIRSNRWEEAFDKRTIEREKLTKRLAMLRDLVKLLESRIANYDAYVASTAQPQSLEELNERLEKIQSAIPHYVQALR